MRFLLLPLAVGILWAQDAERSRILINQGVQAFHNANYGEAMRAFQQAVDLDPSNTTAHLYLGSAYMQQFIPGVDSPENNQMASEAQAAFGRVLNQDPSNHMALTSLASISLSQKKWDEARGWYEKITMLEPRNADAYYSLGFIAWSEWFPAFQQARALAGLKPDAPGPIPDLVIKEDLENRSGMLVEAGIANLQKALELNPEYDDAMAYMNLLIRERADLRNTPEEWLQDIAIADQWIQKTLETKKLKATRLVNEGK